MTEVQLTEPLAKRNKHNNNSKDFSGSWKREVWPAVLAPLASQPFDLRGSSAWTEEPDALAQSLATGPGLPLNSLGLIPHLLIAGVVTIVPASQTCCED